MTNGLLRLIGVAVLTLLLTQPSNTHAKCIVGKKTIITVMLTEERTDGKGSKTLESVTAYLDNRPGLSFRVNGTQRGPWRIPTECSAEMERKLSKQDIERVLATMRTK